MPLRYVLDEHLRGPLWDLVLRHNRLGANPIDVARVGDPPDLPLGTSDPDLLMWAEREGRILVSEDKSTMATHLASHLAGGRHSPGVMTPRPQTAFRLILEFLVVAAHASDDEEWADRISFIP
jgi:hypothetical protein